MSLRSPRGGPWLWRATAAALLATAAAHPAAEAGGMVLPARGVRTLARSGAFVAGADDADALWQNPAGLAHGAGANRRSLLFDLAFVYQSVRHTRLGEDGPLAPVTNGQPGQTAPALAASLGVGDRLVLAIGLAAPYSGTHRYGAGSPQRYASVALAGTTLVTLAAGAAYRVSDRLRVGATVQDTVSLLSLELVASGCLDDACDPEDPALDLPLSVRQTDRVAPSASIGVQYDASRSVTLGLALQAPTHISAPGTLSVALPEAAAFEGAEVSGDEARVSFTLPPQLRAGVELRPGGGLRLEAALGVELWSVHDELSIEPRGVRIEGLAGGTRELGRMAIPRRYRTSVSPALAVEWHGPRVMLGAGYAYETAAAPPATVSVLTVDAAKHLVGLGGGYEAHGWQIGAAAGLVEYAGVDVPLADAAVPQQAPLRPTPSSVRVNAGTYRARALAAGLRFARRW